MEIFDYDNILLLPRKCRFESLSQCDAGVELGPRRFKIPVKGALSRILIEMEQDIQSCRCPQHQYGSNPQMDHTP